MYRIYPPSGVCFLKLPFLPEIAWSAPDGADAALPVFQARVPGQALVLPAPLGAVHHEAVQQHVLHLDNKTLCGVSYE